MRWDALCNHEPGVFFDLEMEMEMEMEMVASFWVVVRRIA